MRGASSIFRTPGTWTWGMKRKPSVIYERGIHEESESIFANADIFIYE